MITEKLSGVAFHLGRLTVASLFLLAAALKITNYGSTIEQMNAVGLTPAVFLLPATIALELGGGLILAIGRWGAAPMAFILAGFTLTTNYFFRDFWTMQGEMARAEGSLFFKNVAIAGGLLFIAGALSRSRTNVA
jgi:putative oxidoreductase